MPGRSRPRLQMWIDAVGGYLICLENEIVIGQAVSDSTADVRILGDLSRRHAVLRRDPTGYLLVPLAPTRLNGRVLSDSGILSDGDEIQLGPSVGLRFRQPHPLSQSCRLELTSHHRTDPQSDGIIGFANSCILGPAEISHIVCRNWSQEIVFVRGEHELRCHSNVPIEIDGQPVQQRGLVQSNSRITGDDFSIYLEEIN